MRNMPLRTVAARFGLGYQSVNRHRSHLVGKLVYATQAEEVADANALLSRVEELITELRDLGREARTHKSYAAAASALAQVRGCLDLLGRLSGELQAAASLSFHKHLHLEAQREPELQSPEELDLQIAKQVGQATENFQIEEFLRLKALVEGDEVLTLEG